MRSLRVIMLAVGLVAVSVIPAFAAVPSCKKIELDPLATPAQAATLMQQSLASGVTLGGGDASQILAGFEKAANDNPALTAELAALVAVARPDLVDGLRQTITSTCPEAAKIIIEQMDESAANPTADQLAAIAQTEGSAPAAGGDGDGDGDGSAQ